MGYRKHDTHSSDGIIIPGCYQRISQRTYRGPDPRLFLDPEHHAAEIQAATPVTSPVIRALDAGLPVTVSKGRIERKYRRGIPWLEGVGAVVVHPDDRVEPTADAT